MKQEDIQRLYAHLCEDCLKCDTCRIIYKLLTIPEHDPPQITEDANCRLECSEYKDPRGTLCP